MRSAVQIFSSASVLLCIHSISAHEGTRKHTPTQLNVSGFAGCLARHGDGTAMPSWPDLPAVKRAYGLHHADGFTLYLALYSNRRSTHKWLNATEEWAFQRWAVRFWTMGGEVASWLRESVLDPLTPGGLFGAALRSCMRHNHTRSVAPFCAALVCHNVLRTIGRPQTYVGRSGADYLPPWYESDAHGWLLRAPRLAQRMISLRRDDGGERWGDWYHTFGVLAFGLHEAALEGARLAELLTLLVASANELLNPLLVGDCEDPVKAQVDVDAARLAGDFAHATSGHGGGDWASACATKAGYALPAVWPIESIERAWSA